MGMHEGRARLGKSAKELTQRWAETRTSWNDTIADRFEKKYLKFLEIDVRSASSAMDSMGQLLHQIRRDCE